MAALDPITYCTAIAGMKPGERELHQAYHDHQYGFPLHSDNELFCRLVLEINQAGLSWTTILKKQQTFREAYDEFDIATVAAYRELDVLRLLQNPGIIRNRLKIQAAIENARTILNLQQEYGSFKNWLDQQHPLPLKEWTLLFRHRFRFTGGEIIKEFLMSTGYLPGAHQPSCPVYHHVLNANPAWNRPSAK
ncbi:MAG TPA: DNA-3-methyladenine glycosylase I [Lacibacter sp.]|nr:DNA-3-methyladenine glycosylase I [Lacibacter sp.]